MQSLCRPTLGGHSLCLSLDFLVWHHMVSTCSQLDALQLQHVFFLFTFDRTSHAVSPKTPAQPLAFLPILCV